MENETPRDPAAIGRSRSSHYITFRLGDELFAVNVSRVREVLDLLPITRLPMAPAHLRGMVNVRGSAVSVVDLRSKFGLPRVPDTVHTRIIVVELSVDGESCVLGGLADGVHEVVELEEGQIRPPPATGLRWRAELIQGICRRGEQFVIIFDIDKVFTSEEVAVARESRDSQTTSDGRPGAAP